MKKMNYVQRIDAIQELEARKLQRILTGEEEDKDNAVKTRVQNLYGLFKKDNKETIKKFHLFYEIVENKDAALFLAFERIGGFSEFLGYIYDNHIS